jgi:lipopolysaccharide/colanic/teichoic acid biosynthesis glycosyltransferase
MTDGPLLGLIAVRTVDCTPGVRWELEDTGLDQGIGRTDGSTAQSRDRLWWKRPLDFVVSGALLLAMSPLLGALTLLIRLESPGPALYRQQRVGLDGQLFTIYKLRTMLVMATSRCATRASRASVAYFAVSAWTRFRSSSTWCGAT